MFAWFSKNGTQTAQSAPTSSSSSRQQQQSQSTNATGTATATTPISSSAGRPSCTGASTVMSPARDIPRRSSGLSFVASDPVWPAPPMARTSSFSSTDSRSSTSSDSLISVSQNISDPSFSYAASYTGGRTSAFLSDDELKTDLAAEPSYRAARLSLVYNSDSSRNTLCSQRQRPHALPVPSGRSTRRSSNRSRMNAIDEES